MWNDLAGHIVTAIVLWSAGLVLVDAGTRLLRVRSARTRQLALWVAYVSLLPGTLVSFWYRPAISLLPARPAPTAAGFAAPADAQGISAVALVLLAAMIVGGALALRAWLGLRTACNELTPCADTRVESLLAQLKHDLGIRQGVQCFARTGPGSPFSAGWLRPLVVLPESILREADDSTLEHILSHELVHIRHADFALNALQKLTRSLAWFNPLAHLYDVRLDQWRELACDAEVLAHGAVSRGDYARTLLSLSTAGTEGAPVASVALIRRHSNLKQRVKHMRITQTRDRLFKKVLLGSLAAIPFVLISCSNSEVNGPAETAVAPAADAEAAVLNEVQEPGNNVWFGELHVREDGSKELNFVHEDGSEGVLEFTGDHAVTDSELHTVKTRLDNEGNTVVDWIVERQETDEPQTLHLEIIEEPGQE